MFGCRPLSQGVVGIDKVDHHQRDAPRVHENMVKAAYHLVVVRPQTHQPNTDQWRLGQIEALLLLQCQQRLDVRVLLFGR